jgi:hypothetical protein
MPAPQMAIPSGNCAATGLDSTAWGSAPKAMLPIILLAPGIAP